MTTDHERRSAPPAVAQLRLVRSMRALVLCVAATLSAYGGVPDDEKEILRLEATIKDAWLKRDTATIASIVADDFQSWSFRGERRSKADMLRTVAKSDETDKVIEDSAVHIYGDTGIYTARLADTGKHPDGRVFSTRSCLTAIFIRRDGRWQLVAEQQAIIPATPSN